MRRVKRLRAATVFARQNVSSLLSSCLFQKQWSSPASKVRHVLSFHAMQVAFEQVYYAFAQKPYNLLWATLKAMNFALVRKRLQHLEGREIVCFHCVKTLNALSIQGLNSLKQWIQCLGSNVVDRLFVVTSQSTKDRRVQTLGLDTNQLAMIRDPTVQ